MRILEKSQAFESFMNTLVEINPDLKHSRPEIDRRFVKIFSAFSDAHSKDYTLASQKDVVKSRVEQAITLAIGREVSVEFISLSNPHVSIIKTVGEKNIIDQVLIRKYLFRRKFDTRLMTEAVVLEKVLKTHAKLSIYFSRTEGFRNCALKHLRPYSLSISLIPIIYAQLLISSRFNDASKMELLLKKIGRVYPLGKISNGNEKENVLEKWLVAVA